MNQSDYEHLKLSEAKGKRARRREFDAVREPGHLRAFFRERDNLDIGQTLTNDEFRQLMRSYRHSCHCSCCAIVRDEKRRIRKRARHEARAL